MQLIKLWNNSDREIMIDMDFKPETDDRSFYFHKHIIEFVLMMVRLPLSSFLSHK